MFQCINKNGAQNKSAPFLYHSSFRSSKISFSTDSVLCVNSLKALYTFSISSVVVQKPKRFSPLNFTD